MVPKLALLTNVLLASAALAVPSARLEARLTRHRQNRQSQPLKDADGPSGVVSNVGSYTTSWAGVVISDAPGTFTSVTGTFAVPTVSGSSGSVVSIWVGIDGDTCPNAILQTGVDITVGGGYAAWYEWYPDYAYDFSGISINAGDIIRATVNATTTTSGLATIENLTNGQTISQELTSSYALCQQDAEWIFEVDDGGLVSPPDFGTVVVTDAIADGSYTPSSPGASVTGVPGVTTVTVNGSTITFQYV